MAMEPKKSKGRQKIDMKKMEGESRLVVTFSKRRYGLFKKASELCTLCGAEVAVIVFSPNGKVYSFGHPDVESVIDRFLTGNSSSASVDNNLKLRISEMNKELTGHVDLLNEEKKKGKMLDLMRSNQPKVWWESPVEELSLEQLEQLKTELEMLRVNVVKEAQNPNHALETAIPDPMDDDENNCPMESDP